MCAFLGLDGVLLSLQLVIAMLPVGMRLFHGIVRKAFHGPTCGRVWYGKIYLGGNRRLPLGFQFPISIHPATGKINLVFIKDKTKARVQSFCFL